MTIKAIQPVALITGGTRGIGAATARLLAQQGYALCLNYRQDEASAKTMQQELSAIAPKVIIAQADVAVESQVVALFERIDNELGALTALVNNAGKLAQQMPLVDMSASRVSDVLMTNVMSCFLCSREAVKRMSTSRGGQGGSIVNVGSAASYTGAPNEYVDYAASKGAIDSMTKGLSLEVAGDGIRVNGVRPGCIYTQMHADGGEPERVDRLASLLPMGRGGQPEEVAEAIAWLLSNKASFATGTFIDLAGGR